MQFKTDRSYKQINLNSYLMSKKVEFVHRNIFKILYMDIIWINVFLFKNSKNSLHDS